MPQKYEKKWQTKQLNKKAKKVSKNKSIKTREKKIVGMKSELMCRRCRRCFWLSSKEDEMEKKERSKTKKTEEKR